MSKKEEKRVFEIVWVCCFCALLIIGAVLGVLYGLNYKSNALTPTVYDSMESLLVIEDKTENGIALTSNEAVVASDGTTSQVVTAQAFDSNGDNVDCGFDWFASWNNAESDWASGKKVENYIILSPSEDTKQCTVSCTKGFSEQIVINVSAMGNAYAKTSVTVDYVKRITSVTSSLTLNDVKYTDGTPKLKMCQYNCSNHTDEHLNTIKLSVNYSSVGTVKGKFVLRGIESCGLTDENNQIILEAGLWYGVSNFVNAVATEKDNVFQFEYSVKNFLIGIKESDNQTVCDVLLKNPSFTMQFGLYIDLYYNDVVVQEFVSHKQSTTSGNILGEITLGFNTDYLAYNAASVKTNDSSLTF